MPPSITEATTIDIKLITPLIGLIIGLTVWCWKSMERTQNKLEKSHNNHIEADDEIHNQIFAQLRETRRDLDQLIGEHKARKRGVSCE